MNNKTKSILKTTGTVLLLIFIALCFGLVAHTKGYKITLSCFLVGTTWQLSPYFAQNIGTFEQILSIAYIVGWLIMAFFSGRKEWKNLFRGMMIYSALPFIGLIGYPFFYKEGIKLGIMLLATLIWGYPFFPVIITESSIDSIVTPIGVLMFVMPLAALLVHYVGKKLQY